MEEDKIKEKLNETLRRIEEVNKKIGEDIQEIKEKFQKKVTKFGNSGHIPMPAKYVGEEAIIRIIKKPEEKKE